MGHTHNVWNLKGPAGEFSARRARSKSAAHKRLGGAGLQPTTIHDDEPQVPEEKGRKKKKGEEG